MKMWSVVVTIGWILTACRGSARPVSSWADATKPSFHPTRTAVAFMTTDRSMRRVVEDRLAARLPGGIPSYRLIPDNELMAMDAVKGRLTTLGFTSVLMLRLAAETSRPTASGAT